MNNPPGNDPNVYNSPPPPPPAYGSMPPPQSYTSVPPPPRQNNRVWMYVAIGLAVACVLCVGVAGIVTLVGGNLFRSVAATVQPQLTQMAPTMQAIATQIQQPAPPADNFSPLVKGITLSEGVQGDNLDPVNPTNVFKPADTIHAVVQVADVPDGTKFKMIWYAEDVGDAAAANTKIAEYELPASGTRNLDFTLAPNNQWPEGLYRGELFVNGAADRVVRFHVKP